MRSKNIGSIMVAALFLGAPLLAFAAGSASVAGLTTDTVGVGTNVTFSVIVSGFTNPSYQVIDSFGGGANNTNIDGYGNFSWTPNNSELGDHTITVNVTDSSGSSASASQTIHVVAPTVSITSLSPGGTVKFGNVVTFGLSSTGFMGVQYSVADSFANSTVSSANTDAYGNFHWTPLYQDVGTHTLVATARDYQGHSATASQQIVVLGPALFSLGQISPASTVHVGDMVTVYASTTGYTSPTFTVSDSFTSGNGTSTLAVDGNGKVTWTPNANDIGGHQLTVGASDSSGNAGSAQVLVTVIPAAAPYAAPVVAATTTVQTTSAATDASATGAYTFTALLTVGSSGKDVTALQTLLSKLGFLSVAPTGYFGAMTKRAVQYYQTAHGISPVGYTGPATRAALNSGK